MSQPNPKLENCPTCGEAVESIFDHVAGCPDEVVVPTKAEELDQEYLKFYDLRVYTVEQIPTGFYDGNDEPITKPGGKVLDVPATFAKIEAAKARAKARRERHLFTGSRDLTILDTDSRQVKRHKARLAAKNSKPPSEHQGFNRAGRRAWMGQMSRTFRRAVLNQAIKNKADGNKVTESLDIPAEV